MSVPTRGRLPRPPWHFPTACVGTCNPPDIWSLRHCDAFRCYCKVTDDLVRCVRSTGARVVVALAVEGVRKQFADGLPVLDGLDLAVADGEFFTLLGPSGCGKTT